jgi:hypothetical protein
MQCHHWIECYLQDGEIHGGFEEPDNVHDVFGVGVDAGQDH